MAPYEIDLPVIDLAVLQWKSGTDSDHQQLAGSMELQKLREACQELGFFHVINHGINPTLLQTLDSTARDMFTLPTDIKERAALPNLYAGYISPVIGPMGKESVPESICFQNDHNVDQASSQLWPQGNHTFCKHVREYRGKMIELSMGILKLILSSLGLDVSKHCQSTPFDNCEFPMRMNFYHNNKNLEAAADNEELFSEAHTDISCLTVLYQDDVGGLQIRTKEGKWVDTKPFPGSFAVNIGDCLQMWSNCRYRSAEHRVVYGGCKAKRLSIAFFLCGGEDGEIYAPEELIDEKHPRLFRACTRREIKSYVKNAGASMGGAQAYFQI